jgi:HK97 family phage major capsid protein/HK97 family phage prohead protease
MTVIEKSVVTPAGDDPLVYVMSDETVDRYGDIVEARGWSLVNFTKNPIALFGHDSKFIVGNWTDVKVMGGKLIGTLKLLPAGVSQRLDEIRAAVEAGVLRAVSVGFRPLEAEPIANGGMRFKRAELVECSLVSIPANPNAIQLAKSLNLSDDAQRTIFGKSADEIAAMQRGYPGEHAAPTSTPRNKNMTTLSQRIVDAQASLTKATDDLNNHVSQDGADPIATEELCRIVEEAKTALAALQRAEQAISVRSAPGTVVTEQRGGGNQSRPFAVPEKKVAPKDYVLRSAVVSVLSHVTKRSAADVMIERYGEDPMTRAVFDVVTRAASAPATTTTTGWAAELVQTAIGDFIESLLPFSVYPALRDLGGRFTFGRNGIISLPSRNTSASVGGSFVGQGAPIPVRQGAFSNTNLTPKKLAVISTFTREIAEHSTPSIEGVLREAIQEDTGVSIDTVLLDATAASTIRPAGLRNGVTVTTATAGGGFAALVGDLKALIGALIANSGGNVRKPVWIMNPVQVLSASVTQNAGGDFPFKEELAQGKLMGYPVLSSATVPAGMVILVDAADFFSATGDDPRFDVSDQATLHMEDTSPAQIAATGTPNVVAAPVRSMFQTDSLALRMIMDMNWAMRRTGTIAWTQTVTW